jgi:hypothetical protein
VVHSFKVAPQSDRWTAVTAKFPMRDDDRTALISAPALLLSRQD